LKKLLKLMASPTTGKPKWRDASWREAWNAFRAAIYLPGFVRRASLTRFWSVTHAQSADECPLLGANRTFDRAAAYQSRFMSTRPSSRMSASRLILNKVHLRQSEPGFAPVARIEPNPSCLSVPTGNARNVDRKLNEWKEASRFAGWGTEHAAVRLD